MYAVGLLIVSYMCLQYKDNMKDEGSDVCKAQDPHKKLLLSFPLWFLAIYKQTNNNNKNVSPEEYFHPQKETESLMFKGVAILAMNQIGMN